MPLSYGWSTSRNHSVSVLTAKGLELNGIRVGFEKSSSNAVMEAFSVVLFALIGGVFLVPGECDEVVDVPGVMFELLMGHMAELSYRLDSMTKQMEELELRQQKQMTTQMEKLEHRLETRLVKQIDALARKIEHMDQTAGLYRVVGPDGLLRTVYRETVNIDSLGHGWTVIQRRTSGALNFDRPWLDYQNGFGDVEGDHWLGLEMIRSIISTGERHELLVVLETAYNEVGYAHYDDFQMGDERDKYRLNSLGSYSGNAGDSLRYHEGSAFSTKDRDNDNKNMNCAEYYHGGWWFHRCLNSFLNGRYNSDADTSGIVWKSNIILAPFKKTTMMIRSHTSSNDATS
uniref:Fibrinogen C-terminal domain-containing protein n=1 Tax=Anopheles atroparvus TaxID=41427 RepID=A0A182JJZ0_ANOAO